MHPNGQIPAYEFAFGDVNPPVHAWACWRVYKMTGAKGQRDRLFLERAFQKLLLNFTWWVNRKDPEGRNLFAGGFLGLDNIGVFDRSRPLPTGGHLEQADGTAWMAFYCNTMLSHGAGARRAKTRRTRTSPPSSSSTSSPSRRRSTRSAARGCGTRTTASTTTSSTWATGTRRCGSARWWALMPLIAAEVLDEGMFEHLEGFRKRMQWFLENRPDVTSQIACMMPRQAGRSRAAAAGHPVARAPGARAPIPARRERVPLPARDPVGLAGASRAPVRDRTCTARSTGWTTRPREGTSGLFGGNSNWRGPVWFPINYLVLEALERYHHFYGDGLKVECPVGSGRMLNLQEVAGELERRLASLFLPDASRPPALPRRRSALRERPPLEGPGAVSRVLPRGQRPRRRGQPSDRAGPRSCSAASRTGARQRGAPAQATAKPPGQLAASRR